VQGHRPVHLTRPPDTICSTGYQRARREKPVGQC